MALNGLIDNGNLQCNLTGGGPIVLNHTYNLPGDFKSCSLVQGGFYAGTFSNTYSATQLYTLSGYNGQCGVLYGPLAQPPSPPLSSNALSVGGKVFVRVGPANCTLGGEPLNYSGVQRCYHIRLQWCAKVN